MRDIAKKFGQRSYTGLEVERLRTEELLAEMNDIGVEIEKHGNPDTTNHSFEEQLDYISRIYPAAMTLAFTAVMDVKRKLKLLETAKEKLDEQAAHIEWLETTLKAHGLDVDR